MLLQYFLGIPSTESFLHGWFEELGFSLLLFFKLPRRTSCMDGLKNLDFPFFFSLSCHDEHHSDETMKVSMPEMFKKLTFDDSSFSHHLCCMR